MLITENSFLPQRMGHWNWTASGKMVWSSSKCVECRMCLTARKFGEPLKMKVCEDYVEDQVFEFGLGNGTNLGKAFDTCFKIVI